MRRSVRATVAAAVLMVTAWPGGPAAAVRAAQAPAPARQLSALLAEAWEEQLREDPLRATSFGDARYNALLPSVAPADRERRARSARRFLERLRAIDRGALTRAERVSYDMFERELRIDLAEERHGAWRLPITADSGFHTQFAQLPSQAPLATVADYESYTARLRAFPAFVRQQVANMREGLRAGVTLPRVVLEGYEGTAGSHVVDDPEKSVFWAPFRTFPAGVPEGDRERLRAQGRAAIAAGAVAGYRELHDFFVREYLPGARTTIAAVDMPGGRAYYEHLVWRFTSLPLTPEQVHQTGLAEVARIRAEMQQAMRQAKFQGELPAFLEMLRTDKRFFVTRPEDLLKQAAWIAKRADGALPRLFGRLPRQPYGVEPVPAHIAPKYTAGRYVPGRRGGLRGGTYWVNTYALESRPLWALTALTLHEAVPGHHLQFALQRELDGLPAFRSAARVDAFSEGWGLYAERLGLEVGFYEDPYDDFGRLTYEMWRACRLVVDTGMHALGWTRQRALDYMAENTSLTRHEIGTEIDRYISWPGQALAYKIGELKIRELRARAERELGPRFDLRAFHDAVLANGAVPLNVLEEEVTEFIKAQQARN